MSNNVQQSCHEHKNIALQSIRDFCTRQIESVTKAVMSAKSNQMETDIADDNTRFDLDSQEEEGNHDQDGEQISVVDNFSAAKPRILLESFTEASRCSYEHRNRNAHIHGDRTQSSMIITSINDKKVHWDDISRRDEPPSKRRDFEKDIENQHPRTTPLSSNSIPQRRSTQKATSDVRMKTTDEAELPTYDSGVKNDLTRHQLDEEDGRSKDFESRKSNPNAERFLTKSKDNSKSSRLCLKKTKRYLMDEFQDEDFHFGRQVTAKDVTSTHHQPKRLISGEYEDIKIVPTSSSSKCTTDGAVQELLSKRENQKLHSFRARLSDSNKKFKDEDLADRIHVSKSSREHRDTRKTDIYLSSQSGIDKRRRKSAGSKTDRRDESRLEQHRKKQKKNRSTMSDTKRIRTSTILTSQEHSRLLNKKLHGETHEKANKAYVRKSRHTDQPNIFDEQVKSRHLVQHLDKNKKTTPVSNSLSLKRNHLGRIQDRSNSFKTSYVSRVQTVHNDIKCNEKFSKLESFGEDAAYSFL